MTYQSTMLPRDRPLQQTIKAMILESQDARLRLTKDPLGSALGDTDIVKMNGRGREVVRGEGEEDVSLGGNNTSLLLTTNGRQTYSRSFVRNTPEHNTPSGRSTSSPIISPCGELSAEDHRVPPHGGSPRGGVYQSTNLDSDRDWSKRTPIALDAEVECNSPASLPPSEERSPAYNTLRRSTTEQEDVKDVAVDKDERDFGDGEEDRGDNRTEHRRLGEDLNATYDEEHPTVLKNPLSQRFFAADSVVPRDTGSSNFRLSESNQFDEPNQMFGGSSRELRLTLSGATSYDRFPRSPVSPGGGGGFTPSDTPMSPGQRLSPHEPIWMRQSTSSGPQDRHLSSGSWAAPRSAGPVSPKLASGAEVPPASIDKRKGSDGGGRIRGVGSSTSAIAASTTGPLNQTSARQAAAFPGTVWQHRLQGAFNSLANKFSPKTPRGDQHSTLPMKPQDQKIIALMIAKKEEEARERVSRELLQHQWEAEQSKLLGGRGMAHRRSTSQIELNSRRHKCASVTAGIKYSSGTPGTTYSSGTPGTTYSSGTPGSGASGGTPTRRVDDDDGGSVMGETQALKRQVTSARSSKQPAKEESNHWPAMREKQSVANEKRRSVEQRLEQQRREMEEHRNQMREKQEQDLQRANSVRMSKEQQHALRAKLKNVQNQQKMEKINQMKQQSMLELNNLQEAIETKMTLADQKVQRKRELDGRRQRDDLQRRIEQSRMRQQQAEAELKNWQQELLQFKEWQGKHADSIAREALLRKKEAACNDRLQKEQLQRDNMKRLLEQEDQWLADVEASIVSKDARSILLNKDKEDFIQRSRAMASNSQRMREDLRSCHSTTDLDQWQFQAAHESRTVPKFQMGSMTSLNPPLQR